MFSKCCDAQMMQETSLCTSTRRFFDAYMPCFSFLCPMGPTSVRPAVDDISRYAKSQPTTLNATDKPYMQHTNMKHEHNTVLVMHWA